MERTISIIAAALLGLCGAAQAAGFGSLALNAGGIKEMYKDSDTLPAARSVPAARPEQDPGHQALVHACAKEAASFARLALDAKANSYGFIAGDIDLDTMIVEGMTRDGGFIYTLTGYVYKGEYFITVVTDSSCGAELVHLREVLNGEDPAPAVRPYRSGNKTAAGTGSRGAQLRCTQGGWTLGVTIDGMAGEPRRSPFILFKDGAMVASGAFEKEYEGYDSALLNAYAWTFRNAMGGLAVAADGFTAPAPGTWPAMAEIALETPAGFFEAAGAECTLTIK
jgi:hypothetical protein